MGFESLRPSQLLPFAMLGSPRLPAASGLSPGSSFGAYQILSPLGAGGMGLVYRARDEKLGRDVALKLLPDLFAADADRLSRFDREARTLAAINHPGIAQIFGIEEWGGRRALVMELVEGEDLSQLMARGPVPIPDAIGIARQIASALEAAHDLGIVHRDLKPANIRVRPDGAVKVLDFGLAKAAEPLAASGDATVTSPAVTVQGLILGTAAYMAPEQARGRAVDKRADIWAFGVVLYEMLTGTRLFAADSVADTIALVVSRDPDMRQLPAATPAHSRRGRDRRRRRSGCARRHAPGRCPSFPSRGWRRPATRRRERSPAPFPRRTGSSAA